MLLTDQDFGVSARHAAPREPGIVGPPSGRRPATCCFDLVPNARSVRKGDLDRHRRHDRPRACRRRSRRASRSAPSSRIEHGEGELDRRIHVKPAADLRRLDIVAGPDQAPRRSAARRRSDARRRAPSVDAPRAARRSSAGSCSSPRSRRCRSSACPADLTPLLVASVGFLAGSIPGAVLRLRPRPVHGHRAAARRSASTRWSSPRSATAPAACASCATPPTASPRSRSAPPPPRSPRSASRCCSSCSASTRRSRCCSCARS